ncbi:MAG: hypothetical protein NZ924_06310 [Candidatus Bipolaricaulota bacterium]|nr:hypothetical protein [Candidatus Bipolaricaulota bacterium]MDW8152496.1 hypothetical protein [Candidatus Bipolaricaulota bacterium]
MLDAEDVRNFDEQDNGVGRYGRKNGAEYGAAYWAKRAREAYLKNPKGEDWKQWLGWATHYLADALAPQGAYNPKERPDTSIPSIPGTDRNGLDFWYKEDVLPQIPGWNTGPFKHNRGDLLEWGLQVLDLYEHHKWTISAFCDFFSKKFGLACEITRQLVDWFLEQKTSWQWLKHYREWVKNPDPFVLPEERFPSDFQIENPLQPNPISNWIVDRSRQIARMNKVEQWPYLVEGDMKKVFALISIGIRGLFSYVTDLGVTVSSPNGGEAWVVGSTVTIRWRSSVTGKQFRVNIQLSRDGGSTWETIIKNTANDGEEKWKVKGSVTTQALIRIVNADGGIEDASDGQFAIVHPGIVAGTSNPGKVYVLRETGWEEISEELGFAVLSLIEHNGKLYAGVMTGDNKGRLYEYAGGKNWKLVCDNLDRQVSSLAIFRGKLYIGTSGERGRLYQFDGKTCPLPPVVDHKDPGGWRGFRSAYVWGKHLYLGDIAYDVIGRFDGKRFEHIVHLRGSCIFDFADYKGALFAAAWMGTLYKSPDGTTWTTVAKPESTHLWELEVFKGWLYMGFQSGYLRRFDGMQFEIGWTAPTSIIAMVAHKDEMLYIGTGGEAGYLKLTTGTGRVYAFDGIRSIPISGVLGSGVQVLYVSNIRALAPKEIEEIDIVNEPQPSLEATEAIHVVNMPNPVRDVHTTRFIVLGVEAETVRVEVYDLSGRLVWKGEAEGQELPWHTEDLTGLPLANGVYLYLAYVKVGDQWIKLEPQKLVILR